LHLRHTNMRKLLVVTLLLAGGLKAMAQIPTAADTTRKPQSPVETLSYEQYQAYVNGIDINQLNKVAALYNYPLPDAVLALATQLKLSPEQVQQLKTISSNLKRKLKEMGADIIKNETQMSTLFKNHKIDDGTLIYYNNTYGGYLGETRNAILQACLKTRQLLSPAQLSTYARLQKDPKS
jgi:hypothetical protein